jgi:hypothetical protein
LVSQVGDYTGRPTVAQSEWIGRFEQSARKYRERLEAVKKGLP